MAEAVRYKKGDKAMISWRISMLREIIPEWERSLDQEAHELSSLYQELFSRFIKTDTFRGYDKDRKKQLKKYIRSEANYHKFMINYFQIDMTVRAAVEAHPDMSLIRKEDLALRTICDEYLKLSKRNFYRKEKLMKALLDSEV